MTILNAKGERILCDLAEQTDFTAITRYWSDARFRAHCEAEREAERARCHAAIDISLAASRARQAERWESEDE